MRARRQNIVKAIQYRLIGEPSDAEIVAAMTMDERVQRAIALLRKHEPKDGYYGAFSGGKDSCTIKALAAMAHVKVDWWYNNTTIDPPELVHFVKQEHPDVMWHRPKHGNMLHRIATAPKVPPTRRVRWCCEEYKEWGGDGRVKIMGVRQQESRPRKAWREVAEDVRCNKVVCPIVFWSEEHVWEFLLSQRVSYCRLYDEPEIRRIGCVGCPLNDEARDREFQRWPKYAAKWKAAVIANWEKWHDVPRRDGDPRMQSRFASGEDFWNWYVGDHHGRDLMRECQSGSLWTNEDEMTADSDVPEHSEIRSES